MNGYLLSVIGTVLLCSLLTAIAPEGKTSAVVKGVARLTCILAIIAPVLQFFKTGSLSDLLGEKEEKNFTQNVIEEEGAFIQYYCELRIQETEKALKAALSERYGLDCAVSIAWSAVEEELDGGYTEPRIRVDGIAVTLLQEAQEEVKEAMLEYVKKNYCSEVLIE